ncbi:MAG: hypothetical protein FHP92_14685 [Denitromonas halophila]|nr:MAG: hypothetical protein FHP92_14685 [Denitromonas halophila]
MPARTALLVALLCSQSITAHAELTIQEHARRFLAIYSDLTERRDVDAADLYRPTAKVRVSYFNGETLIQSTLLTGEAWKDSLRRGWFDNTNRLDAAQFENVRVVSAGPSQIAIFATRISQEKCYLDTGYAVRISPQAANVYRIIQERISIQMAAACQ